MTRLVSLGKPAPAGSSERELNVGEAGLKQLFFEMRPALARMLAARGAIPDEVEDLLQDLFVRLETRPIGPVGEGRAYLYRMADNLLVDRRRSAARRSAREEAWSTPREEPSLERVLIGRDQLAAVQSALASLPDRSFEIFRRFRLDGTPQKLIAQDLGISVSAVEKHLQRAYRAIVEVREALDADSKHAHRLRLDGSANER